MLRCLLHTTTANVVNGKGACRVSQVDFNALCSSIVVIVMMLMLTAALMMLLLLILNISTTG